MRHQSKRKYADRKKLNRKYHSQKAYRKEQKRKTGWRARWDKFTDRLANIFEICFLLMIPIFIVYMIFFDDGVYKDGIYGLWQSENHKLAISYEDGSKGSKRVVFGLPKSVDIAFIDRIVLVIIKATP